MTTVIKAVKVDDGLPDGPSVKDLYQIQYWDTAQDINGASVTTMTSSKTVSLSDQRNQLLATQQILKAIADYVMAGKLAPKPTN